MYLWIDDSAGDDAWVAFAKDFATSSGKVVKLADNEVMENMQHDERMKVRCETFGLHFSS